MPKKIRQLVADLKEAGFKLDRQKGSHRQFTHSDFRGLITLRGGRVKMPAVIRKSKSPRL